MCPSNLSGGDARRPGTPGDADRPAIPPWIEGSGLVLQRGGQPVLQGLSLSIGPGLTLVRGGEQRGKTSLLQLLASEIAPDAGLLRLRTPRVFRADRRSPADDALTVTDWWQQTLERYGMRDDPAPPIRAPCSTQRRAWQWIARWRQSCATPGA